MCLRLMLILQWSVRDILDEHTSEYVCRARIGHDTVGTYISWAITIYIWFIAATWRPTRSRHWVQLHLPVWHHSWNCMSLTISLSFRWSGQRPIRQPEHDDRCRRFRWDYANKLVFNECNLHCSFLTHITARKWIAWLSTIRWVICCFRCGPNPNAKQTCSGQLLLVCLVGCTYFTLL